MASAATVPNRIVPVGTEHIYTFNATVNLGTKTPTEFGTSYVLTSNLHLTGIDENSISLRLTNILHQSHNGHSKLPITTPNTPILEKSEDLTNPFIVKFDPSGQIQSFEFSKTDSESSINFKKQIATLFQLSVFETSSNISEKSIFGECNVNYQVKPVEPHGLDLILVKLIDPSDCKEPWNNLNTVYLPEKETVYTLVQEDTKYKIKSIRADGKVLFHPNGVGNENLILSISQVLDFKATGKANFIDPQEQVVISTLGNDPMETCQNEVKPGA